MGNNADYSAIFQRWLNGICTAYRGELPSGEEPTGAYIIYKAYAGSFARTFIQPLRIYKPKTSDISAVIEVVDALEAAIGDGGVLLHDPSMNVKIMKGDPWYQDTDDEKENFKSGYVNLDITIYQKER